MAIKLGMTTLNLLLLHLLLVPYASAYEDMIIQQVTQRKTAPLALYVDPLPQTQKIYAYPSTTNLTIGMYQTTQQFHRDLPPTPIFAYGPNASSATFPGPTIETLRGTPTYVTWENNLPPTHILPVDTTINAAMPPNGGVPAVVHLHGGVIAPDSDGSAFAWYTANYASNGSAFTTKTYTYPNVQHAGNLMYHDHALGLTRINLLAGLLGGYVIRDPPVETPFNLPTGDEFDRHLVIADRSFNADGTIYMNATGVDPAVHPVWQPEYFGDAITVNGKIWPFLNVQRRKYRFRIINASNARYLSLSFSANGSAPYPFTVIGSDSSYLGAPVTATSVVAAVAETFDIVFDFSAVTANEIELINAAPYPYPNGLNIPGNYDSKVMNFVISPVAPVPADTSSIPATLVSYEPAMPSDATTTRYIALYEYFTPANQVMHLYVNGKRLADPVTETPTVGSTELWYVINLTGDDHPLHLHLAHIQAVSSTALANPVEFKACMEVNLDPLLCNISGNTTGTAVTVVPDYEKTWKNVVKLPPGMMTTVIAKFKAVDLSNQPYPFNATIEPGYVYHCHILDHEDNEMIRPLKLQ